MVETPNMPRFMGQITLWDAAPVLNNRLPEIKVAMSVRGEDWALNLISILEEASYFIADNLETQKKFTRLFNCEFHGNVAKADHVMLRKEILRAAINKPI